MRFVRDYAHKSGETSPAIYEQQLDVHIKLTRPYAKLTKQFDGQAGKILEHDSIIYVDKSSSVVDSNLSYNENGNIKSVKTITGTCTNPKCKQYGKTQQGNIVSNGTYRTKEGVPCRRFLFNNF